MRNYFPKENLNNIVVLADKNHLSQYDIALKIFWLRISDFCLVTATVKSLLWEHSIQQAQYSWRPELKSWFKILQVPNV